jgi:hypothetical protein
LPEVAGEGTLYAAPRSLAELRGALGRLLLTPDCAGSWPRPAANGPSGIAGRKPKPPGYRFSGSPVRSPPAGASAGEPKAWAETSLIPR